MSKNEPPDENDKPKTALERYLAKQQAKARLTPEPFFSHQNAEKDQGFRKHFRQSAPDAATTPVVPEAPRAPTVSNSDDEFERLALEEGAPAHLSVDQPRETARASGVGAITDSVAATFGQRGVAFLIDVVIIYVLQMPLKSVLMGALGLFLGRYVELVQTAFNYILWYSVIFVYFGWFYTERGATPGKMLFGLQVTDEVSGARLSYIRSFFREAVGKLISLAPLGLGFFIALYREDRKALHDLVFETRVVRVRKKGGV